MACRQIKFGVCMWTASGIKQGQKDENARETQTNRQEEAREPSDARGFWGQVNKAVQENHGGRES